MKKHKKSTWVLLVSVLLFLIGILFMFITVKQIRKEYSYKIINDIRQYNSEKYPIEKYLFPESIPANATAVSFSYFDFFSKAEDQYLELRFDTQEELLQYVSERKQQLEEQYQPDAYPAWLEEQNIYDSSYIDVFCTESNIKKNGERYLGYTRSANQKMHCHFNVMSYSVEDRTVVHAFVSGTFPHYDSQYDWIPQYFVRFSVPYQDEKNQRKIVIS